MEVSDYNAFDRRGGYGRGGRARYGRRIKTGCGECGGRFKAAHSLDQDTSQSPIGAKSRYDLHMEFFAPATKDVSDRVSVKVMNALDSE